MPRALVGTLLVLSLLAGGCSGGGGSAPDAAGSAVGAGPVVEGGEALTVDTLGDPPTPPAGRTTLRSAVARARVGQTITFAPSLDGGVIDLELVGNRHSTLKAEVYSFAAGRWTFEGYQERDYGRSALYARKDLVLDASALPRGITVRWQGAEPARVLAVYGDLAMRNVSVVGGRATAEALAEGAQPYTLARGAGVAVWGRALLEGCTLAGNASVGDVMPARDRGAFGGGLYADVAVLRDCVVSGNSVRGYGAAGGGVYSVGGAEFPGHSELHGCSVTGNRCTGQHAYGGGIYSDGGGPGSDRTVTLENCTLARNLVEDNPEVMEDARSQFYYRGGGLYMSNGSLSMQGCTVVENEVTGVPALFGGKPNMGGGGMAATIGDAHVVQAMTLAQSIVAGNRVGDAADDVFTGSLLHFWSGGYNLVGALDFRYILVPVSDWNSLSRRHWPKLGDASGVTAPVGTPTLHPTVRSVGTDSGALAALWYPPAGAAIDRIPTADYGVPSVMADYLVTSQGTDDFLVRVLEKVAADFGPEVVAGFGDLSGVTFHGPILTWQSNPENAAWIAFWHDLDAALASRLGPEGLADDFWGSWPNGALGSGVEMRVMSVTQAWRLSGTDQRGVVRPRGGLGDVGAVEQ